jgi:hypothetical protein
MARSNAANAGQDWGKGGRLQGAHSNTVGRLRFSQAKSQSPAALARESASWFVKKTPFERQRVSGIKNYIKKTFHHQLQFVIASPTACAAVMVATRLRSQSSLACRVTRASWHRRIATSSCTPSILFMLLIPLQRGLAVQHVHGAWGMGHAKMANAKQTGSKSEMSCFSLDLLSICPIVKY